ncbi:cytochrome c biogenesis protein ResB [Acaryochloris sp. CCMEE 5410]|uniref:cytochrome c biogenesis protein ResB n=1 Tax=Acaryochloris sp. CCMEE 5410 TaxID=310037 RepID=UPI00024838E2|nr:cytochrome c biogenesis protein ResB [Acaryochloris sp. CCMEE 5410]KAI9133475.1 cytochrome c biogenesis protein ResB [Acaryochloris sp. CCMEE 5410]
MLTKLVRFLGSIKLAVPVLGAIASILIWATFYESKVGSLVVQQQIYKSPWFGALMFLLAVNLGVSTLSRYPWRGARKVGFALTHLGLIVLIAGSAAVIHLGVEGLLLVRTDQPANHLVRVEGELLEVMDDQGQVQQAAVMVKPGQVISPHQFAGLTLLDYSDNSVETVEYRAGNVSDNPAVRLVLSSDRMGQTFDQWLSPMAETVDLGPAQLELRQAVNQTDLQQLLADPAQRQARQSGTLLMKVGDVDTPLAIDDLRRQDAVINDIQVHLLNVWPDFRLDDQNQPITTSQDWRNPALEVEVKQADLQERWFVFAQAGPILAGDKALLDLDWEYQVPPPPASDYFRVVVADQKLYYAARSSKSFTSGPLEMDQMIQPGWADFKITLADWLPHAQRIQERLPALPGVEGVPALQVASADGQQWLTWGDSVLIADGSHPKMAAFGPRMLALPFRVSLDEFVVERNEGTDSVAMWTSQIRIEDLQGDSAQKRSVWMNHPTWYQGWKIAQASWNPGDLNQSTLQVKREPLWVTALTWSGALLTVLGVGVMFYGPTLFKKRAAVLEQPTEPIAAEPSPLPLAPQDG